MPWRVWAILASLLGACTTMFPAGDELPPLNSNTDPLADDLSDIEQALFDEINRVRGEEGLDPVVLKVDLICAAGAHSADIGERGACTHTGDDGSQPGDRVEACSGDGWSGEIVACGQLTPEQAVQAWLDSPGHNAIMLDPNQVEVGVGMHMNYWTAIFDQ